MEDEINLSEYWFIVKKNIILVVLMFIVVLAGAIAYTFNIAPVYETRTMIVVTNQDQSSFLIDTPSVRIDMETQAEIIRSASVIPTAYSDRLSNVEIEVNLIRNTNVIEIIAESTDRYAAQRAANSIADSYINFTIYSRKEAANEVNVFITSQIESLKYELDTLNLLLANIQRESPEQELEYQSVMQNIQAKDKLYNYLLSRREEVSIVAQENTGNVMIIQKAELPVFPIRPNYPLNLLVGLILAVISGLGIAFLKEYVRNTFRSIDEIEAEFGPVLGSMPKTRKKYSIYLHKKIKDKFAESIRKLRTNILFVLKDKGIKTIAITSPHSRDGKSTAASNIALAMAQDRKKVLLVDANLRNPSIHRIFRKNEKPGLTDIILGGAELGKAVQKVARNLDIISTGAQSDSPSELFGSNTMKRLIARLDYDVVIFDTPSLEYSETTLIAADCQGTVLVVGFDRKSKDLAIKGRKALDKVKVDVIGVVVNFLR